MLSTAGKSFRSRQRRLLRVSPLLGLGCLVCAAAAQTADPAVAESDVQTASPASVESLFSDFLHYARMGRFTLADSYAQMLFAHPELDPVALMEIADRDPESLQSLLVIIRGSSIGPAAQRVLDLLQKGEFAQRQSTDRILINIDLLGGDPQQEWIARRRLAESGEYAIPLMVDALLDPSKRNLWPRVIGALPIIGKQAVNPLVMVLKMTNNDVRIHVVEALGEIGYAQAIPYLRGLIADSAKPRETKAAAAKAIERIGQITGRTLFDSPAKSFAALANQYYDEDDAVRADPRLDKVNVWYWDASRQRLRTVMVDPQIFGAVMAMRCSEEALRLTPNDSGAMVTWLASNIRREARLDLDVESGDPGEAGDEDATRPDVFPRALYFTQAAGPRYAHLVLDRAVRGRDSSVALGAIEALRVTAGESSLIGTEDFKQPLVEALQFPDLLVRFRAALALGAAMPKSSFAGSIRVMPLLSSALLQSGREQVLAIDPDLTNLNRVVAALRGGDREVIGESNLFVALDRARIEFQRLGGIVVSTEVAEPGLAGGLAAIRMEFIYSKTPVVVLASSDQAAFAADLALRDPYVEVVDASAGDEAILDALERVRERTGQALIDDWLAESIAIQSAETLFRIAADGRTIFDASRAEPALINVLSASSEKLQILATSVLSQLGTPTAQRAIAHVALNDNNTESFRVASMGSLAVSAKINGSLLEDSQTARLVEIAHHDANLIIRTAASQALGAINLGSGKSSDIIRSYYGG